MPQSCDIRNDTPPPLPDKRELWCSENPGGMMSGRQDSISSFDKRVLVIAKILVFLQKVHQIDDEQI